jgi:release factor glutamine methyltransferase
MEGIGMTLNEEQKKQIEKQLEAHNHKGYKKDIKISEDFILKDFLVHEGVLRPEVMTSLSLAKWLFFNNGLYKNKAIIDIGCGSGLQGIVVGLAGAKKVIFSDISEVAVENTKQNISLFNLNNITSLTKGNLFENVPEKAEVIVFNHPFFSDAPFDEFRSSGSMLGGGKGQLLRAFLEESKKHLTEKGVVIMPYFKLAGEENDPEMAGPEMGYEVQVKFDFEIKTGLQKGRVTICELRLK